MNIKILDTEKFFIPKVFIDSHAFEKIRFIVDHEPREIGFMGSVSHDPNSNIYVITDVFITKQKRSATTTEQSGEGLNELTSSIIRDNTLTNAQKKQRLSSLNFWGHSHVDMGVSPSERDLSNALTFQTKLYLIAAIFNKRGDIRVDFYDFEHGIVYENLEVQTKWNLPDETITEILEDIRTKVSEIEPKPSYYSIGSWNTPSYMDKVDESRNWTHWGHPFDDARDKDYQKPNCDEGVILKQPEESREIGKLTNKEFFK